MEGDGLGTAVLDPPCVHQGGSLPTPLHLGRLVVDPLVVLAPMAGITNAAFPTLCAESGAGLQVAEMTTARGVADRDSKIGRGAHPSPMDYPLTVV